MYRTCAASADCLNFPARASQGFELTAPTPMTAIAQLLRRWRWGALAGSPPPAGASHQTEIAQCSAEIAALWRDHHVRVLPAHMRIVSLDRQIEQFSTGAFQIVRKYPSLREATDGQLWLIYFKGLLISETHAAKVMKDSIRMVADRHLAR
jgi:hypothetical protein